MLNGSERRKLASLYTFSVGVSPLSTTALLEDIHIFTHHYVRLKLFKACSNHKA